EWEAEHVARAIVSRVLHLDSDPHARQREGYLGTDTVDRALRDVADVRLVEEVVGDDVDVGEEPSRPEPRGPVERQRMRPGPVELEARIGFVGGTAGELLAVEKGNVPHVTSALVRVVRDETEALREPTAHHQ